MRNEQRYLANYIGSMLKDSDYIFFVSYQGLAVKDISELRNQLATAGAQCRVLKNKLIIKAAELAGIDALAGVKLAGGTAVIYGKGEAPAVAKLLVEYGKTRDKLSAKGGLLDGAFLSSADVAGIADLPSKDVMRAMLLGVLQAPSRNLVSLLNAKAATILNVLSAYKDKLENK